MTEHYFPCGHKMVLGHTCPVCVNADLVAALEAVEWVCDAGLWYCPCCKQQRTKGHKTDCQLAAALAKAKN